MSGLKPIVIYATAKEIEEWSSGLGGMLKPDWDNSKHRLRFLALSQHDFDIVDTLVRRIPAYRHDAVVPLANAVRNHPDIDGTNLEKALNHWCEHDSAFLAFSEAKIKESLMKCFEDEEAAKTGWMLASLIAETVNHGACEEERPILQECKSFIEQRKPIVVSDIEIQAREGFIEGRKPSYPTGCDAMLEREWLLSKTYKALREQRRADGKRE